MAVLCMLAAGTWMLPAGVIMITLRAFSPSCFCLQNHASRLVSACPIGYNMSRAPRCSSEPCAKG